MGMTKKQYMQEIDNIRMVTSSMIKDLIDAKKCTKELLTEYLIVSDTFRMQVMPLLEKKLERVRKDTLIDATQQAREYQSRIIHLVGKHA